MSDNHKGPLLLSAKDLQIRFRLRSKELSAVRGASLDVYGGETVALVGESGSGKSVFTKSFIGMLDKNGRVEGGQLLYGKEDMSAWKTEEAWLKVRGKKIAMVFQDPMTSLNPVRTIGEQIAEVISWHYHAPHEQAKEETIGLLKKVGISDPEIRYRQYPGEFSGGMRQRAVIAAAIACRPEILICDEPTTALDVTVQAQILELIRSLQKELEMAVIFITHDLGVVANIADWVAVMYAGQIIESGTVREIFKNPAHPYTLALLRSLPQLGVKGQELYSIPGAPPSLYKEIRGDAFAPRNPKAMAIDFVQEPPAFPVSDTHWAKSWLLHPYAAAYRESLKGDAAGKEPGEGDIALKRPGDMAAAGKRPEDSAAALKRPGDSIAALKRPEDGAAAGKEPEDGAAALKRPGDSIAALKRPEDGAAAGKEPGYMGKAKFVKEQSPAAAGKASGEKIMPGGRSVPAASGESLPSEKLLEVKNLTVRFRMGRNSFTAVDQVSFDMYRGETLSLVGESGSGKTTIGRAIMRIYNQYEGDVLYNGKKISGKLGREEDRKLRMEMQMIFQDPMASLNERAKVDYIISEGLYNYHLFENEQERLAKVENIMREVGLLGEFSSRFPHEFSGGQRQRIGIARSLVMNPEFLVADEPISALDMSVRAQVINLLNRMKQERNLTYLFIAHDLSVVRFISDRVAVIYKGRLVELAPCEELFQNPLHPYTKALLSAIPYPDPDRSVSGKLAVYDASMHDYSTEKPKWEEVLPGHFVYGNAPELERYRKEAG